MNWALAGAGITAVLVALVAQMYLRVRIRQMGFASKTMREFRELAVGLLQRELPDEARTHIQALASTVGSGQLTRKLMRTMVSEGLDTPIQRATVRERREMWADYSREARIMFTQAVFAGILADSYFAGFIGTALRRSLFYVKNNAAEVAESIDAFETRLLIVESQEITREIASPHYDRSNLVHA